MKLKKYDNFFKWRERMRSIGKIPNNYPAFIKNGDLAEYIGVILGDGNISKFPRTERLIIVGNSNNPGFIERYSQMTEKVFNKKPSLTKLNNMNAVRISIYQKKISKRLGIQLGDRSMVLNKAPKWITNNKSYLIRFLKGLFEAEGSFSIHLPSSTYNFQFKNSNSSLLRLVEDGLKQLGYHPEVRYNCIRLRKKVEALDFEQLISFKSY